MQSVEEGFRGNDGLRQHASPPDQVGKQPRMEGIFVEKSLGVGTMRNGHVEGHRAGIEAAHDRQAILTRTAKEWGVSA